MPEPHYRPVLLIEDDPATAEVMKLSLELEGFWVSVASEGQQALDILHSGEVPAVIFMDLRMAGMDGVQFRAIQAKDPRLSGIHVVVMSGTVDLEHLIPAHDNVSYLHKPVSLDQFIDIAKRLCA
jgi:CheY-like chemotaxis protein